MALGLPRATYYRRQRPQSALPARARSPRALSAGEQATVLDVLHEPRFVDQAPAEVYATLLDEGHYHCSERTMYRLLAAQHEVTGATEPTSTPHYRGRSCWPGNPTSCGAGTSPSFWVRRSGPTSTSTWCSTSSAATSWAGWWRIGESAALAAEVHRRDVRAPGHRPGQLTLHADRGRDDLEIVGVPSRRPRRDEDPSPAACLQRQPVLGGPVQDLPTLYQGKKMWQWAGRPGSRRTALGSRAGICSAARRSPLARRPRLVRLPRRRTPPSILPRRSSPRRPRSKVSASRSPCSSPSA